MAKYHLNPEHGPKPCRAKTACPYGADAPHFTTLAEAQAAYEKLLHEELPLAPLKRKALPEGLLLRRVDELLPEEAAALADGRTLRQLNRTLRDRRQSELHRDGVLRQYATTSDPFSSPSPKILAALQARRDADRTLDSVMADALRRSSNCRRWEGPAPLAPSAELSVAAAFAEQDLSASGLSDALPRAILDAREPKFTAAGKSDATSILLMREELAEKGEEEVLALLPQKLSPGGAILAGLLRRGEAKMPNGLLIYVPSHTGMLGARCQALAALSAAKLDYLYLAGEGVAAERLTLTSPVAPGQYDSPYGSYREERLGPWLSQHALSAA